MNKTPIYIHTFETLMLRPAISQVKLTKHLAYLLASAECVKNKITNKNMANKIFEDMLSKVTRYGVSSNHIKQRQYCFLPDKFYDDNNQLSSRYALKSHRQNTTAEYDSDVVEETIVESAANNFPLTHPYLLKEPRGETVDNRMLLYQSAVMRVLEQLYKNENKLPNSLVHATCTGYISPSPAQTYFSKQGWHNTQVIHAYQMGCYAAIPSLNIALGLVAAGKYSLAKTINVDVFHSELVSANLKITDSNPGHIVNTTLFGDGFAKYSVSIDKKTGDTNFKVLAIETLLVNMSLDDMSLIPTPYSFEIFISKNVPLIIGENIYQFMQKLFQQINIDFAAVKNEIHYAIHPGGPKILKHIVEVLEIDPQKMHFSNEVFYNHGNMVAATLPHVWKNMLESPEVKTGDLIVTVAFGPGLTVTGALFEKV